MRQRENNKREFDIFFKINSKIIDLWIFLTYLFLYHIKFSLTIEFQQSPKETFLHQYALSHMKLFYYLWISLIHLIEIHLSKYLRKKL